MSKIIVNQIESSDGTTDVLNSLSAVSVAGGVVRRIFFDNTTQGLSGYSAFATINDLDPGTTVTIPVSGVDGVHDHSTFGPIPSGTFALQIQFRIYMPDSGNYHWYHNFYIRQAGTYTGTKGRDDRGVYVDGSKFQNYANSFPMMINIPWNMDGTQQIVIESPTATDTGNAYSQFYLEGCWRQGVD